nr:YhjD/YihY/BrkB family envelope integrity protein [Cellulosimicrobium arenosum]
MLAGGIAYSGLFSLFAILALAYTAFVRVLGEREQLMDAVFARINDLVPGLIATDGEPGIVTPSDLLLDEGVSVASVVLVVVLLFSAASFMYYLRSAVRTMFGASDVGQNSVLARLRGLVGFFLLAIVVLVAAAAGIVVTTLSDRVLDALGITGGAAATLTTAGILLGVLLDAVVVMLVVVFLAAVPVRRRDLLVGALTAGVVFGVLRFLGSTVVAGSASSNPIIGSFAVIATLLVLVNVVARVLLMLCAWMADPPRERAPADERARHARAGRPELPVVDPVRGAGGRHLRHGRRHRAGPDAAAPAGPERSAEEWVRTGQGNGRPWSPIVRGIRRGRSPRGA